MYFLISQPSPGLSLGSFTAAHFLCTATLGFTTKDQARIRRAASTLIFLLTFIGDRTVSSVSDNASIRCLLVTFSWVQAFNGNSLLCLSKAEYKTLKEEGQQNTTPKSVLIGSDASGDGSYISHFTWALAMQWNLRRIKTSRPARNTPPFSSKDPSYIPSRGRFLATRVGVIVASIAYMSIIGLQPEPTRDSLSGNKARFFSRLNDVTLYELLQRAILTVTWLSGIGTTSEICYNVIAVVLVGLGLSEPVMWPSWFGSFTEAYSVRRWWGISWHQTWRCFLTDHADWVVYNLLHLPKDSPITRYAKNLVVFYLSGLIHLAPDLTIGMPLKESSAIMFFTFQAVGIMIEDLVQSFNDRIGLVKSSIVARFDEEHGTWHLKIEQTLPDGSKTIIKDDCDMLLGALGILDRWEYPDIPGLKTFKGRVIHTADRKQWDEYTQDKWAGQTVTVIGSGASSLQTVPGMQPHVKNIEVFVRSPNWFIGNEDGFDSRPQGYVYTEKERAEFARNREALFAHAKSNENSFMMVCKGTCDKTAQRTRKIIKDYRLFEGHLPKFSVGCRRVAPGDAYMKAIQEPNVNVHFCGVAKVREDGVVGDDGEFTKCDTIVCATGFDVSFRPPFPLLGLGGRDLREEWASIPASYMGVMAPNIPNYLMYIGPNCPVENGSIMGLLEAVVQYTVKCIRKMQTDNIKYFVPRPEVMGDFNKHTHSWFKGIVWEDDCNTWCTFATYFHDILVTFTDCACYFRQKPQDRKRRRYMAR
ncbi:hypothetical protein FVEG_13320 [Fusarium verticillioides 7600]|uniref:Wax synthase domain-containing protein n=1 Tax=Gibberella moniliformis (strain M3125 / FGSC 7600) TaxID=334819 RepID=W7MUV2_GIBM7|nr:hypothetical protein FVEG_13320 [Fusarium verticillioides 7600]EWG55298.1 hypothetical protein FVEG_13320 [Fusarium verticillioides 7600]